MQVSILGCGWLGFPLAKQLLKRYNVKGSVTSKSKQQSLEEAGISTYIIDLNKLNGNTCTEFLSGSEVLIICIPPKVNTENALSYPNKIKELIPYIVGAGITKVIFTSSTSVYADEYGIPVIDENTSPNPDTESGRQVLAAEKGLQTDERFNTTILRLGGLIGEDRHPVKYLAGKTGLQNPDAPVNLASRHHIIAIAEAVINQDAWGEVFLVTNPEHPTRKDFYTTEAKRLGLPLPEFDSQSASAGKLVNGTQKIKDKLNYSF